MSNCLNIDAISGIALRGDDMPGRIRTGISRLSRICSVFVLLTSFIAANSRADEVTFCSGFEGADCQITGDQLPPLFLPLEPTSVTVAPGARPNFLVTIIEERSGLDSSSVRFFHDDIDVSSAIALDGSSVRYTPATTPVVGNHTWRIEARDLAGNLGQYDSIYRVTSSPTISEMSPHEIAVDASDARIAAKFADPATDLNADRVELTLDGAAVDVTNALTWVDARSAVLDLTPAVPLAPGRHVVELRVANDNAASAEAVWGFWIKDAPIYLFEFIEPPEGTVTQQATIRVAVRAGSNRAETTSVLINGEIAKIDSEADGRVFRYRDVPLSPGTNTITAIVGFSDGETRTLTRNVVFDAPPVVQISAPLDFQTLGPEVAGGALPGGAINQTGNVEHPVRVTGTTDRTVVRVEINQQLATLDASGTAFAFDRFFLHEGTNVLTVSAFDAQARSGTSTVTVYVDHTAPLLLVEGPANDAVTSAQRVDVRGSVSDAVAGLVNTPEAEVTVRNLANDTSVIASVYQSFFLAPDLRLELGSNELEVTATDGVNNARVQRWRVSRIAVGSERVLLFSGNRQQAEVGTELAQPLVVNVIDAEGLPRVDREVRFDVVRGDGRLTTGPGVAATSDGLNPARNLVVRTDAAGMAKVWFALGSESGLAANVVRARSDGIAEEVLFTASGQRGSPKWVLADGSSGTQFAATNSRVIEPLTVVMYDEHYNRVENATVEYRVLRGDARFDALSWPGSTPMEGGIALRMQTDRNGNASARPLIGFSEGNVEIAVRAVEETDTPAAVFSINALAQSDAETKFSGTVLDHTGRALAGVSFSIARTALTATSDSEGRFQFDTLVPPGKIDLFVDGRNAPAPPGIEYPALHFETAIVRGRENQLPHPIYLPPVNLTQAQVVGGDHDVTLTIPGLEGFEMIVKAGSVTFPDGSRVGPLVVSPVHVDRLPMVPTGGSATFGPVAWTIQPASTRFDPPIEVRIPNTGGLAAGETVTIVQWDHDLAAFVPMGLGTVNETTSQIVSIPGSGITKAGWGGCTGDCPPPPPNCASSSEAPRQPEYNKFEAFNLRTEFFGWIEYEDIVPLDRISMNHRTRFKDKTFRLTSSFFFDGPCDSVSYEWLYGDGGSGAGEVVEHQYEQRGPTTVRETIICNYTQKCSGASAQVRWPNDEAIKRRDTRWVEFKEAMDGCNWTADCWLIVKVQEELGEIGELLGQTEIEWLSDIQDWSRETIDRWGAGSGQVGQHEAKIASLAVLHATNETLFPVSLLDVVPIGKATKALRLIRKKYGASVDEVAELAEQIAHTCGSGNRSANAVGGCKLTWQKFEDAGRRWIETGRCNDGCLASWKPVRNENNGFDGAVIWRDADGKLRLTLTESKHWWKTKDTVEVSDLTAFGFGDAPGTLQLNLNVVLEAIEQPGFVQGASRADIDQLIEDISRRRFDVALHVLIETKVDWAPIRERIRELTGGQGELQPLYGWEY